MPFILPPHPSLERLRRLAKQLLAAVRRGAVGSLARLRSCFPDVTPAAAQLFQAQTVLAREYSYSSWLMLCAAVERRTEKEKAKAERAAARTADARTLASLWFTLAEQGDLEGLLHALAVGKRCCDRARALMLTDEQRYDRFVDVLMTGLSHPDAWLRSEFAHALDTFGDARCVASLARLIDDPVPRVRWMAMHALTCHACNAESCTTDPEVLEAIAHHAKADSSSQVRRHATVALGLSGVRAMEPTLRSIAAEAVDPALKRSAEYGLRVLAAARG